MVKIVGGCVYAHKSNLNELLSKVKDAHINEVAKLIRLAMNRDVPFDIIKYNGKTGDITLITSPDWDIKNEPIVGECRLWKFGNFFTEDSKLAEPKMTANFKQVYHNKWQFVSDDYKGFNIEEAKRRTSEWTKIIGVDKKRIGYYKYWINFLHENGLSE